jgi:ribokinase
MKAKPITVMGIFVVDLAFRTKTLPVWGETVMGAGFRLGPGGKGSNQSVAAARLGAKVYFISKVGEDNFGDMAQKTYDAEGIDTRFHPDAGGYHRSRGHHRAGVKRRERHYRRSRSGQRVDA